MRETHGCNLVEFTLEGKAEAIEICGRQCQSTVRRPKKLRTQVIQIIVEGVLTVNLSVSSDPDPPCQE